MNNGVKVKVGSGVASAAIKALRCVDELEVVIDTEGAPSGGALVGDAGTAVILLHRSRVSSATAHQIVRDADPAAGPLWVTATEATHRAREILAEASIGTADAQGNMRLHLPGLVVRIVTNTRPQRRQVSTSLRGRAGVVAEALLLDLNRSWHVTEIAEVCEVSAALAHRVLARLEREGIVIAHGAGPHKTRHVVNPTALLDLWDEEQTADPSRQMAFKLAQTPSELITSVTDGLAGCGVAHALTGAAAAASIAPHLTNVLVVYAWIADDADPVAVCEQIGATPVASGPNVVLLQERSDAALAFREHLNGGAYRANRFRVYADLGDDPRRGEEQREELRCVAIGF